MAKVFYTLILSTLLFSGYGQIVNPGFKPTIEGLPAIFFVKHFENDKILISGEFTTVSDILYAGVVMLNSDGSIDENFSTNILSNGSVLDALYDSESSKYYVSGVFDGLNDLLRLNEDGSIDNTFSPEIELFSVDHIGIQSDGKLVVISTTADFGIIRLNEDGSLDETFKNNVGFNDISSKNSEMKILDDDKILIGGDFSSYNNEPTSNLIKLNANGEIDTEFSFSGDLTASYQPFINSILPLSNGDIIIAGNFDSVYGISCKSLARLNSDGSIDHNFTLPGPGANLFNREVRAILDDEENILVSGINSGIDDFSLLRLNGDGELDTSFKTGTIVFNNSIGTLNEPLLDLDNDGNIYFSSYFTKYDGHFTQGLAKINSTGNVITDFNPDIAGKVEISATKIDSDGGVYLGGSFTSVNNSPAEFLAKLDQDGKLDTQFMNNIGDGPDLGVYVIEIDNNDNVLIGGGFTNFNNENTGALLRLTKDGIVDINFTPYVYPQYVGPGVNDILIGENDEIFVGGQFNWVDGHSIESFAKINNDGTLDNSFNVNLPTDANIRNLNLHTDGKLLYTGNVGFGEDAIIGKVDFQGNSDPEFSSHDFGTDRLLTSSVIPQTGELLVSVVATNDYRLIQLNPDGTLKDDISVVVTGSWGISEIHILDSENILIGGQFSRINGVESPGFGKTSLSGGVDSEFNYDLAEIGNFSGPSVSNIIDLGNENYLIAGNFSKVDNQDVTSVAKIDTRIPNAPTGLSGSFTFSSGILLNWNDNSNKESGYELYRKQVDQDSFDLIASLDSNQIDFNDDNVDLSSSYTYRIKAINGDLSSGYSPEVLVVTNDLLAPNQFEFDFDFSFGLVINWQDNTEFEESIEIYKSLNGDTYELMSSLEANVTRTEDVNVDLNTGYNYFAQISAGIFSSISDTVSYTTPESAFLPKPEISILEVDKTIELGWEYEEEQILGFKIFKSVDDNTAFEQIGETTDFVFTDSEVKPGELNFYRMQSFNAFEESEPSDEVTYLITSVNDKLNLNNLVSPNPAIDRINIDIAEGTEYRILGINGQLVQQGTLLHGIIDVSMIPNGMYLLKLFTFNEVMSSKVLIER